MGSEPEYAPRYEGCVYSAAQERDFLATYLGPVLRRDHPQVKIMVYDHNKGNNPAVCGLLFAASQANFAASKQMIVQNGRKRSTQIR
jgi:glucosylceramidase